MDINSEISLNTMAITISCLLAVLDGNEILEKLKELIILNASPLQKCYCSFKRCT